MENTFLTLLVVKAKETRKIHEHIQQPHEQAVSTEMGEYYLMLAGSRYGDVLRRALNQGLEATTSPHRSPRGFPTPQWHGVLTSPDDGPHGFPGRGQSCIAR